MKLERPIRLLLFVIVFVCVNKVQSKNFGEACTPKEATGGKDAVLKLAFVMDITKSFASFNKEFQSGFPALAKEVTSIYPNAEFAASGFADYPKSAQPDTGRNEEGEPDENPEGCYKRIRPFKTSYADIPELLASAGIIASGGRENTLGALAMTTVDKNIGWEEGTAGKNVKKVIVLMTEQAYGNIANPGNRHDFIGDGSDTCSTSKPPKVHDATYILLKHGISLINIIPEGDENAKWPMIQWYEDHMTQDHQICYGTFSLKKELSSQKINDLIVGCLKKLC